ncbi:alpha/beta hydrolase [Dehalococcoidia bacterium]|nr:alpha/beta hydrolase [Dehalococcoidia bacterium]
MPKVHLADVTLNYTIDDFTDPWAWSPWVLLHHSAVGSLRRWYAWVPTLARYCKVLRFDVRGHGDSSWSADDPQFTLETLVADVKGLLDALEIPRVHFIGASGGGTVGLKFAHTHPDRVRSLTLVTSTPRLSQANIDLSQWADTLESDGVVGWVMRDAVTRFGENANPELIEWFAQEGSRTPAAVAKAYTSYMATVDLTDILTEIKAKTLLLAAEQDEITPLPMQKLLQEQLPKAELRIFSGVGHNIKVLIPEQLAAETLAFLQNVDQVESAFLGMSLNC